MCVCGSVCVCASKLCVTLEQWDTGIPGHLDTGTPRQWDNGLAFVHSPSVRSPSPRSVCTFPRLLEQCDTRTLGHQDAVTPGRLDTRTLGHQDTGIPGHRGDGTLGHWENWTLEQWAGF